MNPSPGFSSHDASPALPPPGTAPPGMLDSPAKAGASSGPAAAPLARGPPPSAAEVVVGVEAPPPPPEVAALAPAALSLPSGAPALPPPSMEPDVSRTPSRADNVLAKLPNLPKVPERFQPKMPAKLRGMNPQRKTWMCLRRLPFLYCETVARFPWAFLIFYAMIIAIVISLGWRTLEVNTDIDAFREVVGETAERQRSYMEALKGQKAVKDSSSLADRTTFEVQLFYEAKSGSVFSEAALRDIRSLETLLRDLDGWKRMCQMSDQNARFRCEPGESLGNYAWPDRADVSADAHTPFKLNFTGGSRERLPVDAFLTYLHEGESSGQQLRKFLPHQFGGPKMDATVLRTLFAFTAPSLDDGSFATAYKDFVAEELFPALRNATERAEEMPDDAWIEPWSVRLYFRGHEIEAHEVRYYLHGDLEWAVGAVVITLIVTWLQLRSLFLAVLGLAQVGLVPLIAFVSVSIDKLSLSSFLCIFIVLGLSSNDLLAVKEYWSRVGKECSHEYPTANSVGFKDELNRYYSIRISRTFQALLFRFLPQFLTMCSWLVLLLSLIRPIREFGLFMFTATAFACILCVAVFPPLLVLHERFVQPCVHRRLHRIPAMILEPKQLRFPWRPIARKCLEFTQPRIAKFIWLGTLVGTLIVLIITVVVASNSDSPGLPEVYSPSHHGNAGRPLIDAFIPTSPAVVPASQGTLVCELSGGSTRCPGVAGLHWCEAPEAPSEAASSAPTPAPALSSKCICHRGSLPSGSSYKFVNQTTTLAGEVFASANDETRLTSLDNYIKGVFPTADNISFVGNKGTRLPSLVLEHWESGLTNVETVVQMPAAHIKLEPTSWKSNISNTKFLHTTCYCGRRVCNVPAGTLLSPTMVDVPIPTLPPQGRLLSDKPSPIPSVKEVTIVFGIKHGYVDNIVQGEVAWSFDTTFEPVSPWAQRAMLKMCNNVPSSLNVLETHCWIQDFRTWMLSQGEKFPTQRFGDFQSHLKRFLREKSNTPITAMWMDKDGNMIATSFAFKVPPKPKAKVSDILADRDTWTQYVQAENQLSAVSASNAWATSSFWAAAEAQYEAMSNAWNVALLACAICVVASLLYTWDFLFTYLVFTIAAVAMIWLSFFAFCIFQWEIGPWEIILLVAYLMYAVEPALRIGRGTIWGGYLEAETRIAGNAVSHLPPQLPPPGSTPMHGPPAIADAPITGPAGSTPHHGQGLQIMDDPGTGEVAQDLFNPDAPEAEGSSNNSPTDNRDEAAGRSDFEGRMHLFVLNVSNATFGAAVKLVLCGMMALPCEFRLFTRLGAVTIIVPLLSLPCIFILVPGALVLLPTRSKPDLVNLWEYAMQRFKGSSFRDA